MATLLVGLWPAIEKTREWDRAKALLQPAADLGQATIETGPGWSTWTVHEDYVLIGAAQVRRTVEHTVDVVLVGGRDFTRWIGILDRRIGEWAAAEGATMLTARGRCGWARILTKQGWTATRRGRVTEYERRLTPGD